MKIKMSTVKEPTMDGTLKTAPFDKWLLVANPEGNYKDGYRCLKVKPSLGGDELFIIWSTGYCIRNLKSWGNRLYKELPESFSVTLSNET